MGIEINKYNSADSADSVRVLTSLWGDKLASMLHQEPWEKPTHIKRVLFNDPATIVWFSDGTKVACVCDERDYFDKEKGVLHCIAKKFMGSDEIQRVSVEWEEEKLPFANCGITLYELFGDLLKPEAWDETNQKDLHAFDERGVNNEY